MSELQQGIRRILEDQLAIGGSFLPLNQAVEHAVKTESVDPDASVMDDAPVMDDASAVDDASAADDASAKRESSVQDDGSETGLPWTRLLALIPADSPLHAMTTLDEVAAYIASNVLVPIDETRLNPVPGVGNPHADLMVVGEAPGADEDRKGEPFVGRAGQLLDKILAAIDFARSDVYIANILKSRPPNNRDPEQHEIEAHIPILLRQITLVRPRLILCVGRVAGNVLLQRSGTLKALRQENFHDFHGIPLMVTYHPAALLRSAQYKRPTWEDVQALRARYDELMQADV